MVTAISKSKLLFGRDLRNNPTSWEIKLWKHLRDKNLGYRFKRQVFIGGYIVDFCCAAKKLIIELNGGYHRQDMRKIDDQQRLSFLKKEGYSVLSFWNSEIDKDINNVLEKILNALR